MCMKKILNVILLLLNFSGIAFLFACFTPGIPQADAQNSYQLQKQDTEEVRMLNARKFFIYKVGKSETLYSISKKFGIPQEEIVQFNPELTTDGLKAKMKLWIPAFSWLNKKETATEVIRDSSPKQSHWNVCLITGLSLPKIYIGPDDAQDSSNVDEPLPNDVQDNLSFIEGAIRGAEEVGNAGQKIHLTIRDSENDSSKIDLIFRDFAQSVPNIVITNLEGNQLRLISRNCAGKGIYLLSCAMNTTELIRQNSNAVSLFPSSLTQCREMGKFLGKLYPSAISWLVNTGNVREYDRSVYYKEGLLESTPAMKFLNADYQRHGVKSLTDSLVKGKKNLIFIPSSNEDLVSTILNGLKDTVSYFDVTVVGLPTWHFFESLDPDLLQENHVVLFNSGSQQYNPELNLSFRKYYRERYNAEPREASYAGFDAVYVGSRVFADAKKGIDKDKPVKGLFSDYLFQKFTNGQCLENRIIHPLRYDHFSFIPLTEN